ncbi:MAG: triose-phosphate isomerase [Gammaproteobacteria bacterium]|nr:triose-phosphate isomerase [Gammaproteobacteria bacterium]
MRQPLVAGNWKMNGSRASVRALVEGAKAGLGGVGQVQVAVCPPFVYLADVAALLEGSAVMLGAQNLYFAASGAYTGETSAAMLMDFGCAYVIVGHSERRALFAETDETVVRKLVAASRAGLKPILCVGELLEDRENGVTEAVVGRQLDAVLHVSGGLEALANTIIAYEPIWAIGTGRTASPEQAQDVHAFIRRRIAVHDAEIAAKVQILYGGSVKASNAQELFGMPDIDGGLIGGASLDAQEFLTICRAAG